MKILVTGATSGIGRQLAMDYHKEGHEVWAVGRSEQTLAELAAEGLHTGRVDLCDRQMALDWFAGLESLDLEIHFPRRFTLLLKTLSLLPRRIWLTVAKRLVNA